MLELCWICVGCVLELCWVCVGIVLELLLELCWICAGFVLDVGAFVFAWPDLKSQVTVKYGGSNPL